MIYFAFAAKVSSPGTFLGVVEATGLEPVTFALQTRCSSS
jgi:hypothetical protein